MPAMPPVKYNLIQLQGGLDLVTPTLSLPPGVARDSVNFEVAITGGYSRIPGYERYDGRPNPSDAIYNLRNTAKAIVAFTAEPELLADSLGDRLHQQLVEALVIPMGVVPART